MSILPTQIGFLDYKHAGASCSRFGEPATKLPASRRVRSSPHFGRGMGRRRCGAGFVTHRAAGSVPILTFGADIKLNKRLSFAGLATPDMFAGILIESSTPLHEEEARSS
jgi:hypothetical protein